MVLVFNYDYYMSTKKTGDISEAIVLTAYLQAGKSVAVPFGDCNRYDLIIDDDNELQRVQVKTAWLCNGQLKFSTSSLTTDKGEYVKRAYTGQIEKFAVYSPELGRIYIIPIGDCNTSKYTMTLRLTSTRNGQTSRIKFAEDYEWSPSGQPTLATKHVPPYKQSDSHRAALASACRRKVSRPEKVTLEQQIKETSFSGLGKIYGVSDTTVKKWCIAYGIDPKLGKFTHNTRTTQPVTGPVLGTGLAEGGTPVRDTDS